MEDWSDLAIPGTVIAVRVTPGAGQARMAREGGALRIWVTAPPEDGRANTAVVAALARALGVAPSRLQLIRGASSREKQFRIAP